MGQDEKTNGRTTSHAKTVEASTQTPNSLERAQSLKAAFENAQKAQDLQRQQNQQARPQEQSRGKEPAYQPTMRLHPNTPQSRQVDVQVENRQMGDFAAQKKGEFDKQKADLARAEELKKAWENSKSSGNQVELDKGREDDGNDRGR